VKLISQVIMMKVRNLIDRYDVDDVFDAITMNASELWATGDLSEELTPSNFFMGSKSLPNKFEEDMLEHFTINTIFGYEILEAIKKNVTRVSDIDSDDVEFVKEHITVGFEDRTKSILVVNPVPKSNSVSYGDRLETNTGLKFKVSDYKDVGVELYDVDRARTHELIFDCDTAGKGVFIRGEGFSDDEWHHIDTWDIEGGIYRKGDKLVYPNGFTQGQEVVVGHLYGNVDKKFYALVAESGETAHDIIVSIFGSNVLRNVDNVKFFTDKRSIRGVHPDTVVFMQDDYSIDWYDKDVDDALKGYSGTTEFVFPDGPDELKSYIQDNILEES
jgi:hypothetical protein